MLNQCILVGRIKEIKDDHIVVAVGRPFKNEKGIYDTDMIRVEISGNLAKNTLEFCTKGDLVGIKGRIGQGNKVYVEKITFLSSKKQEN